MLLVLRQCDGHGTACDHEIVTAFIGGVAVSIHHSSHELKSIEWQKVSPRVQHSLKLIMTRNRKVDSFEICLLSGQHHCLVDKL